MLRPIAWLVAAAATVAGVVRRRNVRRARAAIASAPRRRTNADGVLVGAEPITLEAPGDRGVLLLHGFNDTPQSVAELAHALHARGWTVVAPLLPHHGRDDDALARDGRAEVWIAHARAEWEALRARRSRVVLAGQSVGGAIAAILARESRPTALVLLAPYLAMGRLVRMGAVVWRAWQLVAPTLVADSERALRDPDARARSLGHGRFTPRLINEVRRVVQRAQRALRDLRMPVLVVHASTDYRIPSRSAQRAFDMIASADKLLVWRTDSGHVVAADQGRNEVFGIVAEWLEERVPSTTAPQRGEA